ncbi:MAG: DUF4328 domain-containing protein [Actinomycetota bacterium]|nr:DUF4328 domain-containing protein [Actinomycetota bacterium]
MTQAGWYQDPSAPSLMRWWDGQRWTDDVRPGAGPDSPAPGGFSPGSFSPGSFSPGGFGPGAFGVNPASDLAEETKTGRNAALALVAGAAAYTIRDIVYAFEIGPIWRAYRRWIDAQAQNDGSTTRLVLPRSAITLNLVSPVISLVLLVVAVLFLVWFHKAATVAMRAGLPARRSPAWAVAGFFIPIVNWWFPYQSAADLFPLDHPGRQKVKRWWALWLATGFLGIAVGVASIISTGAGLAMAVVTGAVAFAAASAGRAVIDEVDRVHAGLLGR